MAHAFELSACAEVVSKISDNTVPLSALTLLIFLRCSHYRLKSFSFFYNAKFNAALWYTFFKNEWITAFMKEAIVLLNMGGPNNLKRS
jgi:hypothetical protein